LAELALLHGRRAYHAARPTWAPPARGSEVEPDRKSTSKSFVIDDQGGISVDLKAIDVRAVRANVERFKAAEPQVGIVVVADRRAPMGVVVSVTDQIRLAGVSDITFTTTTLASMPTAKP
jgi:biopolymer transport protein ExbD